MYQNQNPVEYYRHEMFPAEMLSSAFEAGITEHYLKKMMTLNLGIMDHSFL